MLLLGQAVAIGVYMEHLVSHLLVVPQYLVDDLLWAADQGRTALDGVLERMEHRLHPPPAHCRQPGLEDRAVRRDGLLRRLGTVVAGGAGADQGVRGVVLIERSAFPVVSEQGSIRLDGIGDVRREQRITPLGGQIHGILAGRTAVPDPDRLLQRAWPGLGLVQRRTKLTGP